MQESGDSEPVSFVWPPLALDDSTVKGAKWRSGSRARIIRSALSGPQEGTLVCIKNDHDVYYYMISIEGECWFVWNGILFEEPNPIHREPPTRPNWAV